MSGRVVPATGNITFASNASLNAVCQVFAPSSNKITSLCNVAYNPSTRPPGFISNFVPGPVPGTPLNIRFFDGDSKYITAPTTLTIKTMTTTTFTPTLSGGGGDQYHIAIGTSAGGNQQVNWRPGTNDSNIIGLSPAFVAGTNYYISAYASNSTLTTSSIAVSNATAYGIPALPGSVTLSITKWNQWSISWTAPSGIAPTSGYTWSIYRTSDSAVAATGTTAQGTTTFSGTTELLPNYEYTASVYGMRPESTGTARASSSVNCPLLAPTNLQYTLQDPSGAVTYAVSFRLSWLASGGSVQYYDIYINDTYLAGTTNLYYDFTRENSGSWNQFFRLNVRPVARALYGTQSANSYHAVWTATGTSYPNFPGSHKWRLSMSGGGGGGWSGGGAGTGVKALLNSKISGVQTMYIAQAGKGAHGGSGSGGLSGDGGDMTYLQNGYGIYVGGGGGAGGNDGVTGGGGSAGGQGGGGYNSSEYWVVEYDDQGYWESIYASLDAGGYSGDQGGGGDGGTFSTGGGYSSGVANGGARNGSVGGNGVAYYAYSGGGGGGAQGGGGGRAGGASASGVTVRVAGGGGAGSSSASSHFTEYNEGYTGSPASNQGYIYMGTYDDGT